MTFSTKESVGTLENPVFKNYHDIFNTFSFTLAFARQTACCLCLAVDF